LGYRLPIKFSSPERSLGQWLRKWLSDIGPSHACGYNFWPEQGREPEYQKEKWEKQKHNRKEETKTQVVLISLPLTSNAHVSMSSYHSYQSYSTNQIDRINRSIYQSSTNNRPESCKWVKWFNRSIIGRIISATLSRPIIDWRIDVFFRSSCYIDLKSTDKFSQI